MRLDRPSWGLFFGASMRGRWGDLVRFGAGPELMAQHSGGRVIYLATPYSREVIGEDGAWSALLSCEASVRAALFAELIAGHGATAISPIVMAAEMCHATGRDPLDAGFWTRWCMPLLAACGSVAVPDFPGWQRSDGIWREVVWALEHSVPVTFGAAA